jgi:chromosome segregation ATPase
VELSELKAKVFALLKEDLEFRYAVAGLLGYEELLKRLDRHGEELTKVWTEIAKLREDMNKLIGEMAKGFKKHDEALERLAQELVRLREEMASGFKRHDEALERHGEELAKLRDEMAKGFKLVKRRLEALGAQWG